MGKHRRAAPAPECTYDAHVGSVLLGDSGWLCCACGAMLARTPELPFSDWRFPSNPPPFYVTPPTTWTVNGA